MAARNRFKKIMSDTDLEEQKYELLALKEIIGEENLKVYVSGLETIEDLEAENSLQFFQQPGFEAKCKIGGRLNIAPTLNNPLKILWTDQK